MLAQDIIDATHDDPSCGFRTVNELAERVEQLPQRHAERERANVKKSSD